ncbi:amidohydrolase family protein [Shewanella fidelis]|uniref:Amidohydrolase family protein n=1 Tax=Shewanella fidelis TaxID=173509 RepID=A0AAW8NLB0_9GAMM|nr:amidohydrolase family protein [Shewanella fidelis]MDR8523095.1 amidohydrolase family protein [Shewanella fidelis]MDW4811579.1 amidohydrolase family protein [Shewanella fidelis]MDW4815700.1 amidohydrolase family protein [Shewanella fidelis]MDW4819790.1 amidohydrolase family protein [Shewanella fidelis]MDW4824236.1 amidohydrolase family protein [Shewanella fidelis]
MTSFKQVTALLCLPISFMASSHDMLPAAPQSQAVLFTNATVHTVTNGVLEQSDVLVANGEVIAVGQDLDQQEQVNSNSATGSELTQAAKADYLAELETAHIIDANGKHLYPGLIALDTTMGLVEVEMMRPSNDAYEVGFINPQLEAITAFNPDSEIIPTVRVNGITHAQVVPQGDGLAGQSALVSMDSWTIEDALVESDKQFHLYWPHVRWLSTDEDKRKEQLADLERRIDKVFNAFADGKRYLLAQQAGKVEKIDLRWQALAPLYEGKGQLFIHAQSQQQIEQAIALAKLYNFNIVIVGGYDAWRIASALAEVNAKVIYTQTLALPKRKDEPIDLAFKIPALLKQAQVPFALGFSSDWNSRNLPFAAGQSVAYGLTKDEALQSITLDAAKVLGIDNMGAIAPGYKANIILATGDILDPMQAGIESIYIDGRKIDLNNRHQQLYQKYLKR